MNKNRILVCLMFLLFSSVFSYGQCDLKIVAGLKNNKKEKQYKSAESYIMQEVIYGLEWHKPLAKFYRLKSEGGMFYIAKQEDITSFLNDDSVNLDLLSLIIEPNNGWNYFDSTINKYVEDPSYSFGIENLLLLDNTELYKIGNKIYAIRKIRYTYCDEIELFKTKYRLEYDTHIGEILSDTEEDNRNKNIYINIRDHYVGREFRYFLYLEEFLPTDESIKKFVWKRKYELPNFFKENLKCN